MVDYRKKQKKKLSDAYINTRNWYVIHTKPRNEQKVTDFVKKKNIEVYLPLVQTIRQWSDRKKKLMIPLFPNYVFINATETERKIAIQDNNGALKYIFYQKRPAVISPKEIDNIKISLKAPERVKIEDYKKFQYEKGDYVKVTDGMFCGLTGYVTQIRGNFKIIIDIVEISTALSLELRADEVKLIQKITNA